MFLLRDRAIIHLREEVKSPMRLREEVKFLRKQGAMSLRSVGMDLQREIKSLQKVGGGVMLSSLV